MSIDCEPTPVRDRTTNFRMCASFTCSRFAPVLGPEESIADYCRVKCLTDANSHTTAYVYRGVLFVIVNPPSQLCLPPCTFCAVRQTYRWLFPCATRCRSCSPPPPRECSERRQTVQSRHSRGWFSCSQGSTYVSLARHSNRNKWRPQHEAQAVDRVGDACSGRAVL